MMVERRRGKPTATFSVLSLAPQLVPGDYLTRREVDVIARMLEERLRDSDEYCVLSDGSYVIVLPDTTEADAMIVAQRLASEATFRSASVQRRKWMAGIASYPHDAETEALLIARARGRARAA
jgi:GGDEF domain-containing protein